MKIKLESAELPETEVIIRGDVTSKEVVSLLQFLKKRSSGKLILYKEEEQFIVDADEIVYVEVSGSKVYAYTKQDTYEAKQNCMRSRNCWVADPLHRSTKVLWSTSTVSSRSRQSSAAIIASN